MDVAQISEVTQKYRRHFKRVGVGISFFPDRQPINGDVMKENIKDIRDYFQERGIVAVKFSHNTVPGSKREKLEHCCYMLDRMETFPSDNEGRNKLLRWFGFVLGCKWVANHIGSKEDLLTYCHGELDLIDNFVKEGSLDQAFIWLGFVCGCLWSAGHYNIDQLKQHRSVAEAH